MNNRRAIVFVKILGHNGARVFYVILGLGLAITGTLMVLGIIEPQAT